MNKQYTKFTSSALAILCALNIASVTVHATDSATEVPKIDLTSLTVGRLKDAFVPAMGDKNASIKLSELVNCPAPYLAKRALIAIVCKHPKSTKLTEKMVKDGISGINEKLKHYSDFSSMEVTQLCSGLRSPGFLLVFEYAMNQRSLAKQPKGNQDIDGGDANQSQQPASKTLMQVFVELEKEATQAGQSESDNLSLTTEEQFKALLNRIKATITRDNFEVSDKKVTSGSFRSLAFLIREADKKDDFDAWGDQQVEKAKEYFAKIAEAYVISMRNITKVGEAFTDRKTQQLEGNELAYTRARMTSVIIEHLASVYGKKSANEFLQFIYPDLKFDKIESDENDDDNENNNNNFTLAWWKSEDTKTWKKLAAGGAVGGVLVLIGGIAWFVAGKGGAAEPSADQKDALVDTDEDDFDEEIISGDTK